MMEMCVLMGVVLLMLLWIWATLLCAAMLAIRLVAHWRRQLTSPLGPVVGCDVRPDGTRICL